MDLERIPVGHRNAMSRPSNPNDDRRLREQIEKANNNGDFQLAQAILLLFAIITIAANFITDLIYHKLDPRVGIL